MEICSSSRTSCCDFAIDFLHSLHEIFIRYQWDDGMLWYLEEEMQLLQTFDLYLSKCKRRNHEACLERDDHKEKDAISYKIQDLIYRRIQGLQSAYNKLMIDHAGDPTDIESGLTIFHNEIKLILKTDITEVFNYLRGNYWLEDPGLVIDFIESMSKHWQNFCFNSCFAAGPREKLMFVKSFIHFVMFHSVESQQLVDLLILAEEVAIDAFIAISRCCFDKDYEAVCNEMPPMTCVILNSTDPHVLETYIRVLTASKLSRSPDILAPEKNKHVVADFIDCLVHNIMELKEVCTRIPVPVRYQMQKLQEGLIFFTVLLRNQKKFKELSREMENLIAAVVCDVAIVFFSIHLNQLNKEGLGNETNISIVHLLKVLKFIMAEVSQVYTLTSVSGFGFPRTNELGSMDFVLKNLEELARSNEKSSSIAFPEDQIQTVQKELELLRSFLEKIAEQRNHNEKFQSFWDRVMEVTYKVELVIDWALIGDGDEYCLDGVVRDINLMKIEAQEISDSLSNDDETKRPIKSFTRMPSQAPTTTYSEDLVGLNDEVETIIHRLTRESRHLDIVPIVGMPGLGKTTLARLLYSSDSIILCFHIRAWCIVSQEYSQRNLLNEILCCIDPNGHTEYLEEKGNDLADKLYKSLKGKRYLIVLDDVWDTEAWNLLKNSFPDDANGSKILITSRLQSLQFRRDTKAHHLRHLTDKESWELMKRKLFGKEEFSPILSEIGYRIAKSCRGLPLTVVLVAGILANTAQNCWKEVERSLRFSKVLDDENCMKALELSYNHLPDYLKSCFLYFAAFQEDETIQVRRLLWLWISEGFVQNGAEGKSLEDVAGDYVKALVDRSLVMISEEKTLRGAKACRLHDLVHEFSVGKAREESFLHNVHCLNDPSILNGPINLHRVCFSNARFSKISEHLMPTPNLRSLLLFEQDDLELLLPKLLRVLDLRNVEFDTYFPIEVVLLVHLRYLALLFRGIRSIPSAIANLSRLQTFLVRGDSWTYLLPETIWNMKSLRRLYTTKDKHRRDSYFIFPVESLEGSSSLNHLDTLSIAIDYPSSGNLQKILTKFPSLRRLKCAYCDLTRAWNEIVVFDCFSQLRSLKVYSFGKCGCKFPSNLKKLTLSNTYQSRSDISAIGKLPNLEVLKLLGTSFKEREWEMGEGEFLSLRVLKLSELKICSWTAPSYSFPCLEKLVVHQCRNLEEVPSCLGESLTIEMIEVRYCPKSVKDSVKQIEREQKDMGNDVLKTIIQYESEEEQEESIPTTEEEGEEE